MYYMYYLYKLTPLKNDRQMINDTITQIQMRNHPIPINQPNQKKWEIMRLSKRKQMKIWREWAEENKKYFYWCAWFVHLITNTVPKKNVNVKRLLCKLL